MKKAIMIIVTILLLTACGNSSNAGHLSHQIYPLEVSGILEYDGNRFSVAVTMPRAEDVRIVISEPEEISGAVFSLSEGEISVTCGEITAKLADNYPATDGILLLRYMFSLSGDSFLGARVVNEDGVKYSRADYRTEVGEVSVYVQVGDTSPTRLTGKLNGHMLEFVFVNEP